MFFKVLNKLKSLLIPLLLLVTLGFIWGSGYAIAKFAMENNVPPLGYAFWQSAGPAVLVTLSCFLFRQKLPVNKQYISYYAVCGLLGIAIPNTNMYFAASHLPAGLLAVVVNTVPILTYPLAMLAKQEHFDKLRFLGIIFGFIGICFIVLPHKSLPHTPMLPWGLVALLSPLSFASCAVFINHARPYEASTLSLSAGMLILSSVILSPIVFSSGQFYSLLPPYDLAKWIVILEIILSSIGYVLFFQLLKLAGPVFYSLVGGIVSLTGLFWGWVIFHEQLNSLNSLAVLCILGAIALVSLRQTKSVHLD